MRAKAPLIKFSLAASVALIAAAGAFSINQWRAENSWPVQRNFTRQEMEARKIDKGNAIRRAIALSPENAAYRVLLGKYNAYEAPADAGGRGNLLAEAAEEYGRAVALNPSFTDALSYMAWAEFAAGKPFEALDRLETAIALDPSNHFNRLYYGICVTRFLDSIPNYLRKTYIRRAEENFEKGVALYPEMAKNPMVFTARADFYLRQGNLARAISQLEMAGPMDSSTLPYHLRLASLYLKTGKPTSAIYKYRSFLENIKLDEKSRKTVISHLADITKRHPEVDELRFVLGRALVADKDWAGAVGVLKGLADKGYMPARTHYMLGQAYEGLGDGKAAYAEYETTLKYQRGHPEASRKILELFKGGASR